MARNELGCDAAWESLCQSLCAVLSPQASAEYLLVFKMERSTTICNTNLKSALFKSVLYYYFDFLYFDQL
jgi:hypothetical protein